MIDLPFIWLLLLSFEVFAYVVLDGFDLGIGIIFPLLPNDEDRGIAMNTIAPVWDGNETWLVLGGGGLFAAFPLAYSILLPAFYAPLIAMLLSLIFRGVAFEFRWRSDNHRQWWDWCFTGGSCFATFCQGIVLGTFVQGIKVSDRAYAGGWFDWLTPFSAFCGLALVTGYAMLGTAWLVMKTQGSLQAYLFQLSKRTAIGLLIAIAIASLWSPFLSQDIAQRWFGAPTIFYLWPIPLCTVLLGVALLKSIQQRKEARLFPITLGLFLIAYSGLGVSLYPFLVPRHFAYWQVASPDSSLGFLLIGTAFLLPLIISYTAYAYWVFRGKVSADTGYH